MSVATISPLALTEYANRRFPGVTVAHEPINPDYGSWRLQIGGREEGFWLEFSWGPLSGFGATDMNEDLGDKAADIFAPFHVPLDSMEAAERWLDSRAKKKPNKAPEPTTTAARDRAI